MALFDSKTALNHAIRYLTEAAVKRNTGGWVPPKERERQQRDAMRREQQQARQAEKQQKEAARAEEKQQKLLSKQYPTHYMPNVGRQVMMAGGVPDQPQRQLSPMGFYSAAAERAQTLQPSGDAIQMINALKNTQGIKTEELQNAGLIDQSGNVHPDWAGRGKVSREDIVSHLQGQMPQVEETVLGKETPKIKELKNQLSQMKETDPRYFNLEQELIFEQTNNPTKYSQYTLPGGENYREVLLKLPYQKNEDLEKLQKTLGDLVKKRTDATAEYKRIAEELSPEHPAADEARSKITEYNIPIATIKQGIDQIVEEERRKGFRSGHWDDTNVLAHIRMSDRTGPNGEKILHVEELQSDWGQKGKKEGFAGQPREYKVGFLDDDGYKSYERFATKEEANNHYKKLQEQGKDSPFIEPVIVQGLGVPEAPYVTSTEGWTDLALKRVLKEAAEGGYDKVVWTPGVEQAKRYDLSKQVSNLEYLPETKTLRAFDPNGYPSIDKIVEPDKIADYVGKDVADKLLNSPTKIYETGSGKKVHSVQGLDLSVGGEGMKGYYDTIVPKRLQNLAKKHDKSAKLGYTETHHRGKVSNAPMSYTLPSLDITPTMRESILRGQPAYKRGGTVSKKHPALSIAGTHIREEEHGEPIFTGRL